MSTQPKGIASRRRSLRRLSSATIASQKTLVSPNSYLKQRGPSNDTGFDEALRNASVALSRKVSDSRRGSTCEDTLHTAVAVPIRSATSNLTTAPSGTRKTVHESLHASYESVSEDTESDHLSITTTELKKIVGVTNMDGASSQMSCAFSESVSLDAAAPSVNASARGSLHDVLKVTNPDPGSVDVQAEAPPSPDPQKTGPRGRRAASVQLRKETPILKPSTIKPQPTTAPAENDTTLPKNRNRRPVVRDHVSHRIHPSPTGLELDESRVLNDKNLQEALRVPLANLRNHPQAEKSLKNANDVYDNLVREKDKAVQKMCEATSIAQKAQREHDHWKEEADKVSARLAAFNAAVETLRNPGPVGPQTLTQES
ncbi:hypothetical protein LTR66_002499 [Elasticomyces elasticus]|nr:hypothetical protein LTR66_002499 [Elasticomyces elasticus]